MLVATTGAINETYNIGGHNEKQTIDVVKTICDLLEKLTPNKLDGVNSYQDLITYVTYREGHEVRYAINASKTSKELSWEPVETFESGIRKTVQCYLDNQACYQHVLDAIYQRSTPLKAKD